MKRTRRSGFVALMSVVIISAILLMLVFTLGLSAFFNRFDVLDSENKRVSQALAEACVNAGVLRFALGNYTGGSVAVDASDPKKVCKICQVSSGGVVEARAVYNGAYTSLRATATVSSGVASLTSWGELTSAPAGCTLP